MTKRERLLAIVTSYVAEAGRCDVRCTRIYVENRISRQSWNEAIRKGLAAHQAAKVTIATALLSLTLCLAAPVGASAQDMPPLPAQCVDTGRVTEFGGPVLRCVDGELYYQDMDGAGGYNSGIPYRPPGTWVQVTK